MIAKCPEKELAENYKEHKKQFSNIYTKYKVPNYRNYGNNSNNVRTTPKTTSTNANQKKPSVQNDNNDLQKMMENLIKSFGQDIEEKFNKINDQLNSLNNRIKLIEVKTGLDKPKPTPMPTNKNKSLKFNMNYIPTKAALEDSLKPIDPLVNKNNDQTDNALNNSGKRQLPISDNSSSDSDNNNSNQKKEDKIKYNQQKKKMIKISDDQANKNGNRNPEVDNIIETQKLLENEMKDMKNLFQDFKNQFTTQWNSLFQNNNGNGSSSFNSHS